MSAVAVAIAVLSDRRPLEERVWPRWVGWLSVWYAITSLIGVLVPFMLSGPFAWNGLYSFYIGASSLFLWWIVTAWTILHGTRVGPVSTESPR